MLLYLSLGANRYLAATGGVCGADAASAHNNSARGEVGSLNMLAYFRKVCIGVVDKATHTVYDLAEVMGRNFGCHTERNTRRSVYKKLWESDG